MLTEVAKSSRFLLRRFSPHFPLSTNLFMCSLSYPQTFLLKAEFIIMLTFLKNKLRNEYVFLNDPAPPKKGV